MKHATIILVALNIALCSATALASPRSAVIKTVKKTVFEIVTPKPDESNLSYEEELPLDLIPYAIRNDKYLSIGSAFSIGNGEFLTAAHVLGLHEVTQLDSFYLRDADKKVYEIDQIVACSFNRDFAIFTVKGFQPKDKLKFSTNPGKAMNNAVYAVGNALGQGVVIRDGLFTSSTPEEENGTWKWLRFSAAASPGNSGGPLLDEAGNVLGIVRGKSPNENLNYALPIDEVVKFGKRGEFHSKMVYIFPLINKNEIAVLDYSIDLPMHYKQLRNKVFTKNHAFSMNSFKKLLQKNRDKLFPHAKGSDTVMRTSSNIFPQVIAESTDGIDLFSPKDISSVEIGTNGHFHSGTIGQYLFALLDKPDNVPLSKLCGDSRFFMDLAIKGIGLKRTIRTDKTKITSLGKATKESIHQDRYGRIWIARSYVMPFSNSEVITLNLPTPNGVVMMASIMRSGAGAISTLEDLKVMANYVNVSLYGTFNEWREYLALQKYLPAPLVKLAVTKFSGVLKVENKDVSISYKPKYTVSDKSTFQVDFALFENSGKLEWLPVSYAMMQKMGVKNGFWLSRHLKPTKSMSDRHQTYWTKMANQEFPFNAAVDFRKGLTKSQLLHSMYDAQSSEARENSEHLYVLGIHMEGQKDNSTMKEELAKLDSSVKLLN